MHEPVDILDMVVCLVGALDLLLGLPRVDPFENAQPPAGNHRETHENCSFGRAGRRAGTGCPRETPPAVLSCGGRPPPGPTASHSLPELGQAKLQLPDGLGAREVLCSIAGLSALEFPPHSAPIGGRFLLCGQTLRTPVFLLFTAVVRLYFFLAAAR